MLTTTVLFALMLLATVTDLAWHRIYNWTTYPGTLLALGLSTVGSGAEPFHGLGELSLTESLLGLAICGFVMLVCFVMFRVGGGDVKLIAMLGAFLGPEQGMTAMLWTFILGGCVGLTMLIWQVGPIRLVRRAFQQMAWSLRLGGWCPLTHAEREQLQPPLYLAPSALAAVVIVRFSLDQYLVLV